MRKCSQDEITAAVVVVVILVMVVVLSLFLTFFLTWREGSGPSLKGLQES